ncbi:hypothetical protein [Puia dinghuensis]|uniref:hypothetical protein n=1 Tax=Puia dinghuensis TaxID=1792502 RepID=UPI001667D67F|nr:hypothetical protein [Puia dinghuensis]
MIIICLLPFLLLPFLSNMAGDDFNFYNLYRAHGFWESQGFIYRHWAGRYTTTFLNGACLSLDLLRHYYWLPCLLLFASTWWAIFFLLSTLHALVPGRPFSRNHLVGLSFLFFILFLYVQADIATGFYWFSSAIVYQPSFILSLVFAGCLVRRLEVAGTAPGRDIVLLLLIVLIIGCNEMAAVFLLFFLIALIGLYYYSGLPVPGYCWLYLGVAIGMCVLIVFTSGVILERRQMMNTGSGAVAILSATFFQLISVLFAVFKEPLFWFACAAVFLFGVYLSPLAGLRQKKTFLSGLILLLLLVFLSLLTVLIGSRGSLPPRALNNLTGWFTGGALLLVFLAGLRKEAGASIFGALRLSPVLLTGMLAVLLLASVNYRDAWKTVLSGYFYHAVQVDRDRQLTLAGHRRAGVAVVASYEDAVEASVRQVFPHGVFETVHTLLVQKPPLLYYYDGAASQDHAYRLYYGLDSIAIAPPGKVR